jgi:hypothetical protein
MPMRTDCQHYESRTYPSGDTVRKCNLDLAPEAPWRCPEACPGYKRRIVGVGWTYGSLTEPAPVPEPPGLDNGAAALLDAAEDIINAVGPQVVAEIEDEQRRRQGGRLKRLFGHKKDKP